MKIVNRILERSSLTDLNEASSAQTLATKSYERSGCDSRSKTPPRLTKQFSTQVHHSTGRREYADSRERTICRGGRPNCDHDNGQGDDDNDDDDDEKETKHSLRPAKYSLVALKIPGSNGEPALTRTIHPPLSRSESDQKTERRREARLA